jgi:hypothetical protein
MILGAPSTPAQQAQQPLTFTVDQEHGALRFGVFVVFIATWVIGYFLFNSVIANDGLNIIAIGLGFGFAYILTNLAERYLKRSWPSGRKVEVGAEYVQIAKRGSVEQAITTEQAVSALFWTFEIRKRSRVPKGWSMLACALHDEDAYLAVYTFMSPKQIEAYSSAGLFRKLTSRRDKQGQASLREDVRLAGEQRRLIEAEEFRWINGAEMSHDDFVSYIETIKNRFPEWMPIN